LVVIEAAPPAKYTNKFATVGNGRCAIWLNVLSFKGTSGNFLVAQVLQPTMENEIVFIRG
jgi:hypothetical protein